MQLLAAVTFCMKTNGTRHQIVTGVRACVNFFSTSCLPPQSTLNLTNPNFFSVLVQSVSCQVLYMKTVIGTRLMDTPTTIQPLSHRQVKLQRVCFRRAATHTRRSHIVRVY